MNKNFIIYPWCREEIAFRTINPAQIPYVKKIPAPTFIVTAIEGILILNSADWIIKHTKTEKYPERPANISPRCPHAPIPPACRAAETAQVMNKMPERPHHEYAPRFW